MTLRKELLRLSRACGYHHRADVPLDQFEILDDRLRSRSASEWFGYSPQMLANKEYGGPQEMRPTPVPNVLQPVGSGCHEPSGTVALSPTRLV